MQQYALGILAGGQGTRMGGADKGWLPWRGKPMIQHQLDKFSTSATEVLVSANRSLERYHELNLAVVTDLRAGYPGPLAGIEALLKHSHNFPLVVIPCDAPLLPRDLPERLVAALSDKHTVAVAHDGERQQHLCLAIRDSTLLAGLSAWLDRDRRSVHGWLEAQALVRVPFSDPHFFMNCNAPPTERHP